MQRLNQQDAATLLKLAGFIVEPHVWELRDYYMAERGWFGFLFHTQFGPIALHHRYRVWSVEWPTLAAVARERIPGDATKDAHCFHAWNTHQLIERLEALRLVFAAKEGE